MGKLQIPKIIHYCWFGGNKYNETIEKCINSWHKNLNDYKIIKWDESNFDLNSCLYVKKAYENKYWAFVSDYARFKILKQYGGIYLDTDIEIVKTLDDFLDNDVFLSFKNVETKVGKLFGITSSIVGAKKNNTFFDQLINNIQSRSFIKEDGSIDLSTIASHIEKLCTDNGIKLENKLQKTRKVTLYPNDYLCPTIDRKGKIVKTKNLHAIHYYEGTWRTPELLEYYDNILKAKLSKK